MTTNQMATVTIRDVAWKLARGGHVPTDCQACLLEITALKAEEEFSDRPVCVSPVLAGFGRILWDSTPQDAVGRVAAICRSFGWHLWSP